VWEHLCYKKGVPTALSNKAPRAYQNLASLPESESMLGESGLTWESQINLRLTFLQYNT